jgi:hypothetical protein
MSNYTNLTWLPSFCPTDTDLRRAFMSSSSAITTGRAQLVEGGDELAGVRPFQGAKRDACTPTPASAQVPPSEGLHTWL